MSKLPYFFELAQARVKYAGKKDKVVNVKLTIGMARAMIENEKSFPQLKREKRTSNRAELRGKSSVTRSKNHECEGECIDGICIGRSLGQGNVTAVVQRCDVCEQYDDDVAAADAVRSRLSGWWIHTCSKSEPAL